MKKRYLAALFVLAVLVAIWCTPIEDIYALNQVTLLFDPSFSQEEEAAQPQMQSAHEQEAVELVQLITPRPTAVPTPEPTAEPTAVPTPEPTAEPTAVPTAEPTAEPTAVPTPEATPEPTAVPTAEPTPEPTAQPTNTPTPTDAVSESVETDVPNATPTPDVTATPDSGNGNEPEASMPPEETGGLEPTPSPETTATPEPTEIPALTLTLHTQANYAYVNQKPIRIHAAIDGGAPEYSVTIDVYRGSDHVDQITESYDKPRSMEFVWMPSEYGVHTVRFEVKDGSEQSRKASVELPVAVSERETRETWEKVIRDVDLTGNWHEDIVAIAATQVGYTESHRDFILDEAGEKHRYSRYGDWYGYPYSDWCAMFVAFCLNYAGIAEEDYPYDPGCASLKEKLIALGAYEEDERAYVPRSGDLIFFNHDHEDQPQHVGIVESVDHEIIHTIEGNVGNAVVRKEYPLDDQEIVGYANTAALMQLADVEVKPVRTMVPTAEDTTAVTTADAVNMRHKANARSRRIARIGKAGTEVSVLGKMTFKDEVWYYVRFDGHEGYIRGDLLNLLEPENTPDGTPLPETTPAPTDTITIDVTFAPEETLPPDIPDAYACGYMEHAHSDACYDEQRLLICDLPEHQHDDDVCLTYEEQQLVDAMNAELASLVSADEIEGKLAEFEALADMAGLESYLKSVVPAFRQAYEKYMALAPKIQQHILGFERVADLEWLWSAFILYDYPALLEDGAYVSTLNLAPVVERVRSGECVQFGFTVETESYSDTNYGEGRVKLEFVLPYDSSEAEFDFAAMIWLDQTEGYAPVITSETRVIDGTEKACQVLTGYLHMTSDELEPCAIPGNASHAAVVRVLALQHGAPVSVLISAAMEHGAWEGDCPQHERQEKLTAQSGAARVFVALNEQEQVQVDVLNECLAALPALEEVEAVMSALEAAEDMASLEVYIRTHAPAFREAYEAYQLLTERQKEDIIGFENVLDLEWFWSAFILYDYPSLVDDSARVSALMLKGSVPDQVSAGDVLSLAFAVGTQSYTDTNYGDGRIKLEAVLPAGSDEAQFDLAAMDWLDQSEGYAPVLTSETRMIDGISKACQVLTGYVWLTPAELDGYAIPGSFEHDLVIRILNMAHDAAVSVQISAAMEHGVWEGECPAHAAAEKLTVQSQSVRIVVPLTEEEQSQVDALNAQLALLPSADDVDTIMAAFEAAQDMASLEVYMREIAPQLRKAYETYHALSERQQEAVLGFEKVVDLEWFWSAIILYDYPPLTDDSARVSSLTMESEAQDQVRNGEQIAFDFHIDTKSYTDTNYSEGRVRLEMVLPALQDEAQFDLAAMDWLDQSEGYAPVVTSEARLIDGRETQCQVLTGYLYLQKDALSGYAIPGSVSHRIYVDVNNMAHGSVLCVQLSAAMEHGAWEDQCLVHDELEKHTVQSGSVRVYVPLSEEEQEQVDALNRLLSDLPTAEEAEALIEAFEAQEDTASLADYVREIVPQFRQAYELYGALSDRQKLEIEGYEKVEDLEWLWSAFILYDYPELTDDSARVSSLILSDPASGQTVKPGECVEFDFIVETESYTDTCYGEARVKLEMVLLSGSEEAVFDLEAMDWLDQSEGYAPVITSETRLLDGVQTACQVLTGYKHMTTEALDGYVIPGSFTHRVSVNVLDMAHGESFSVLLSASMEHGAWDGECSAHHVKEKHMAQSAEAEVFIPLTEAEQAQVDALNAQLALLPEEDHLNTILSVFESMDDTAGLEAYSRELVPQFRDAYTAYQALSDRQKQEIVGFEKVENLEWFWSAFVLYDYPPLTDDSAYVDALSIDQVSVAPGGEWEMDANALLCNGDALTYTFTIAMLSSTDLSYSEGRVKLEAVLPFTEEQAQFDLDSMPWLDQTQGYAPVITQETRMVDGTEAACQVLTGYLHLKAAELQDYVIPGEVSHDVVVKLIAAQTGAQCFLQISAAMEHSLWEGVCDAHQRTEKQSVTSLPLTVVPLPGESQTVSVSIPLSKTLSNTDDQEHTFAFEMIRLDDAGNPIDGTGISKELTLLTGEVNDAFMLEFTSDDPLLENLPVTLQYRLAERAGEGQQVDYDDRTYLAAVTLDLEDGVFSAQASITDEEQQQVDAAAFVNTLVRKLTVSKTVEGQHAGEDRQFPFEIQLTLNDQPISGELDARLYDGDLVTDVKLVLDEQGKTSVNLGHKEAIEILAVPIGAVYSVAETEFDGYWPAVGDQRMEAAEGTMALEDVVIAFRNIENYVMPKTGGLGMRLLYIAGMLVLVGGAALLYSCTRRKRGMDA